MRVLGAFLLLAALARADPVADAADAVLEAFRAGKELKELAAKDQPDPWLVADELCARGEHDAAEAFAKAAPRVDVEKLPAYIAKQRQTPDDPKRRARLAAVGAPLAARGFKEALVALGPPESPVPDDVVGVRSACARGIALGGLVRLDEAAAAWQAAAEAAERTGWLTRASAAYDRAGSTAYGASQFLAARTAWERWLAVCERRSDRVDGATALGNLGLVHTALGDYRKAAPMLERALAALEALEDRAGTARILNTLGWVYCALGDHRKALSVLDRALTASEELGDRAGAARALANIGNVHHQSGDYSRALSMFERALAAQEAAGDAVGAARTLGGIGSVHLALDDYAQALLVLERALTAMEALRDKVGAARMLNNLALAHRRLGNYARALAIQRRALAMAEALGDKAAAAGTLGNLGSIHYRLGDYPKALSIYERALEAYEALGDKAGVATTLGNIANVHHSLGDHTQALSILERVLAANEALKDKAGAARTLSSLGLVHAALGQHEEALATYERALAVQEALGDRASAAATLANIGAVHYGLGKYAKALSMCERAAVVLRALGDKAGTAGTLGNIALARAAQGDWAGAVDAARRGVALLPLLVGGLGEQQGAAARDQWAGLLDGGVRAGVHTEDPARVLFFVESGRAGSLLEALGNRQRLSGFVIPTALRDAENKARDRERVALHYYRRALDRGEDVADHWKEVEAARGGILDVVQRIRREAKAQADLVYPEAASLPEVQGALGAGEALVSYALLEKESYALVVTAKAARIVALGETARIAEAAEALQRAVARPGERGVAVPPHESFEYLAKRLRKLAVAPLGLRAKRVLVSPGGPLCYVPFAVLLDAEVAYVPSATTWRLLREEEGGRGQKVLALGDPDYATPRDATELSLYAGGRLEPLPESGKEAKAVGDVVLLGKQATLAGLREALGREERWRAVHVACHGLVDPERPVLSALALTGGFLRCLDVYRMRIPSDLVVLSACETAKGKVFRTEGVVGWTRAFLFAGSSRVLVSLWKVDDEATRVLMEEFYEHWKHEDAATALKSAQAAVREHEQWRHPYFWAAWQLWGLAE